MDPSPAALRSSSRRSRFRSWALALPIGPLILTGSWSNAAAECLVRGKGVALHDVVVRPSRGKPFKVDVGNGYIPGDGAESVRAKISAHPWEHTELTIDGAIAFRGTRKNVWFSLSSPVTTASGMIRLLPGALIMDARTKGDSVIGSAVLVVGGRDIPPMNTRPAELVSPVEVPCAALTLDPIWADDGKANFEEEFYGKPSDPDVGRWWQLRRASRRVVLRSKPRWDSPKLVVSRNFINDEDFFFGTKRVAEHQGWMQVLRIGQDRGARTLVTGWIRQAEMEQTDEIAVSEGVGSSDSPDRGPCFVSRNGRSATAYEGPAWLRVGADIHTEPNGPVWAAVRRDQQVRVRYVTGQEWAWVAISGVYGLPCPNDLPAYVRVSSLILPPKARP